MKRPWSRLHPPRRRQKRPPPHTGAAVVVRLLGGKVSIVSDRHYAQRAGQSKGGTTTAGRPNPGRFTSKTGRAAILKTWKTRWRRIHRIGVRIGRAAKRGPLLDRKALRLHYTTHTVNEVSYDPVRGWLRTLTDGTVRTISEPTALLRLGLLKPRVSWVPVAGDIIKRCPPRAHTGPHRADRNTP